MAIVPGPDIEKEDQEMQRSTDRILTTHAGSLPMPPDLSEMLRAKEAGQPYDAPALQRRLASAVAAAVQKQAENGIDIMTDGEQSKTSFTTYLSERLAGIETRPGAVARAVSDRQRQDFPEYFAAQRAAAPGFGRRQFYCIGPLQYTGQAALQTDIDNLKAALAGVRTGEAFIPAVAVGTVEHWVANEYYTSDEAFLFALADALREEYKTIVDAGFILQLDNPNLPDGFGLYTGLDVPAYRKFQELRIAALNRSIEGLPASRIRMHVCWGAHKGPHNTDIPLKDIVDLMLDVQVEAYSIEAANPRHAHEWRLWEHVKLPEGKILIPGVVGHDSDTIEHPELVAERICNYASVVGRDNVIAGTDCGFGTGRLHPTIAQLKFQTLVEGARLASKRLWGR
jgi:5-methyltetrahydropteroyltriglutamate--homocysteine methyltransferase